jgi:hypothetical protein
MWDQRENSRKLLDPVRDFHLWKIRIQCMHHPYPVRGNRPLPSGVLPSPQDVSPWETRARQTSSFVGRCLSVEPLISPMERLRKEIGRSPGDALRISDQRPGSNAQHANCPRSRGRCAPLKYLQLASVLYENNVTRIPAGNP